jgi:TolB-like protein/Flp pilus assembly protein TadD
MPVNFFIRELRRRNVVRVAILYAIVGWLVLQVADLAMPRLGIPPWGVSLAIMLVVLGFPLALVLAWAFEVTPEGIKRTHEVEHHESITHLTGRKLDFLIIGVLAAALLFVVVDSYVLRERGISRTKAPSAQFGATLTSIAVLPFVDMSQAKDQEYLTDGISEELLNVLARVEGFKVAGRTSAFAFKGRDDDLRTIGQKLGVENILEGSVRKQGDRIRVTAQLVKAADGYHLWSDTYDRQLGDVFAIQDDIARQVVGAIRQTLGRDSATQTVALPDEQRPTSNVEAYTHFLRGQHLLRPRERTGMEAALKEFERAVALDAAFARAHVGIANSLVLLVNYGHRDLGSVEQRIEAELDRALALQSDLGEALAVKAVVLAEKIAPASEQIPLLERATAANPSDSQTLVWLAQTYSEIGRAEDEMRTYGRAYAIDPLAPVLLLNYALASDNYGDPETAQRLVDELAAVQPGSMMLFNTRAQLGGQAGRLDEFIRWTAAQVRLDPENAGAYQGLAFGYSGLGDADAAQRHAARLTTLAPGSARELTTRMDLKVREGRLADAAALIETGNRQFGTDPEFLRSRAEYETAAGEYERALQTLLAAMPTFDAAQPDVSNFIAFLHSPRGMFLYRQGGNEAQADRIAASAVRYADTALKPTKGPERGFSLTNRARIAAVSGDRAGVIANLQQLHDTGGAPPAWLTGEPWFRPYLGDAQFAGLLAKFDTRRAEWRRQLAAEGL